MSVTPMRQRATPDLLVLAPCLPYPPDRGDRLRWFQMLKYLAARFRVHVGAVIDPHTPPSQLARIRAIAYETCFVAAPALGTRLRALGRGGASAHDELAAWVAGLAQRVPLHGALACSARMAAYLPPLPPGCARVCDYIDLESDKLDDRARARRWPAGRMTRRTALTQRTIEQEAAGQLDHVLFASSVAAERFAALVPDHAERVATVGNGVDADYFSPHILHRNPYPAGFRALVFAGAMDDWANVEAAEWFARRVFAGLRASDPALHFYIVGARPADRVLALGRLGGVLVTGAVPDLRPWLAHATLAVAPLQSAHGVQNKVLQALAMRQLVLATPAALAGITIEPGRELLQARSADEFADAIRNLPQAAQRAAIGAAARARVQRDHSWGAALAPLGRLFEPAAPVRASGQ
jgi:sugar transferase (PEP-CTERM/EpsH1 system associated)